MLGEFAVGGEHGNEFLVRLHRRAPTLRAARRRNSRSNAHAIATGHSVRFAISSSNASESRGTPAAWLRPARPPRRARVRDARPDRRARWPRATHRASCPRRRCAPVADDESDARATGGPLSMPRISPSMTSVAVQHHEPVHRPHEACSRDRPSASACGIGNASALRRRFPARSAAVGWPLRCAANTRTSTPVGLVSLFQRGDRRRRMSARNRPAPCVGCPLASRPTLTARSTPFARSESGCISATCGTSTARRRGEQ